jgi:arylsulfatase A-like enzyme
MLDGLSQLNQQRFEAKGDPEIQGRIAQYEMAFRMQTSVPELTDISKEPQSVLDLYGPEVKDPGTFAYNCLLARRLAERGVRFTQVFLRGWDHHGNLTKQIPNLCKAMDQPAAALVKDLKQRGMLDDTLVIWGGEFGRTVYSQGALSPDNYGRDHHPRNFTMWMAGGGIKGGVQHGATDDFSYNVTEKPMHIHDLNATILHCLGLNHERLTYKFQGRDFRLTDVHGTVVKELLV